MSGLECDGCGQDTGKLWHWCEYCDDLNQLRAARWRAQYRRRTKIEQGVAYGFLAALLLAGALTLIFGWGSG